MTFSRITVAPLSAGSPFGAKVSGIDWSSAISPEVARVLRAAWARYGVLVVPGADLDDAQQSKFARTFGRLEEFGQASGLDRQPQVYRSSNIEKTGRVAEWASLTARLLRLNWEWHVDASYRVTPIRGVVLRALEVAFEGGDTIFADMARAYGELPSATKWRIDPLVVRHDFGRLVRDHDLPALRADEAKGFPPVEHPLVRQRRNGGRSLFLSPPYMDRIVGWNRKESLALTEELAAWASQDRFCYRHRWRPGDVLVWDNRWIMHRVTPYRIDRDRRVMHGCAILDDARTGPLRPGSPSRAG